MTATRNSVYGDVIVAEARTEGMNIVRKAGDHGLRSSGGFRHLQQLQQRSEG